MRRSNNGKNRKHCNPILEGLLGEPVVLTSRVLGLGFRGV